MSPLQQHAPAGTPGATTSAGAATDPGAVARGTGGAAAPGVAARFDTGATPRRFRGRTLEELLPQIRAALGPDAVVLRRREGLTGGVGGFFQTRFVEVEAVAGAAPGFDAYDDGPAWPEDVSADGVRWLDEAPGGPAAAAPSPAASPAPPTASAPATTHRAAAARPAGATDPIASDATADVLRSAGAGAPIDGAAFLHHLDAAVERRRATAPGATDEPFLADQLVTSPRSAVTRGLLDGLDEVQADPADPSTAGRAAAAGVAPWRPARATADGLAASTRSPADPAGERTPGVTDGGTPASPSRVAATSGAPTDSAEPDAASATPVGPRRTTAVATVRPGSGALARRTAIPPAPDRDADLAFVVGPDDAPGADRPDTDRRPARTATGRTAHEARPGAALALPRTAVPVAVPDRRGVDADVAEYGLIARGLTPSVARSVVLEAAAHGQPLDPGHRIDPCRPRADRGSSSARRPWR
ncbi:hypothetical protein AB0L40_23915, partial [Patulibacter sp. NPDC049589]